MFFNEWNVLVVDDEPDALAMTKLALRNVQVYGLPLKIYTAKNKAEAIELLKKIACITRILRTDRGRGPC